jgi:hypothetical protein
MGKSHLVFATAVTVIGIAGIGCATDDETGEGTLSLELWGEEYIEEGIPAAEFADGYGVVFDRFLVNLGAITVAREGSDPAIDRPAMKVWDLTQTGPFEIDAVTAPAGAYDHTAYAIERASAESKAGNAEAGDLQLMVDNGYSVYVEGTGDDGTGAKSFGWGFTTDRVYDPCHSEAVLPDGGEAAVQVTIHGDHLFYDDAVSHEPNLRFGDIALADADGDGEVTPEELGAYDIAPLADYVVGSLDIDNLWEFIEHMTGTLGHIDGEGHCE